MDTAKHPGVQFAQIFVDSVQFSHRNDALLLPAEAKFPDLSFTVQMQSLIPVPGAASNLPAAAKLRLATVDSPESQYRIAAEIVAIVVPIEGQENLPPAEYVRAFAGPTLYPFARELIANITMRGRFGPVFLKPINFTLVTTNEPVSTAEAPASVDGLSQSD